MFYQKIKGAEINPELTINNYGKIYINEGVFEGQNALAKFESVGIQYDCQEWLDKGARINVFYNPDLNKFTLLSDMLTGPHQVYGYHMGGIILKQPDEYGNCLSKIFLPDNGDIEYEREFDYSFDESYRIWYVANRPENIFTDGFTDGFDKVRDIEYNPFL